MISTSEVFCVLAFILFPRQKILTRVANYLCQLHGLESGIYASRAVPLQTDLFGNLRDDRGLAHLASLNCNGGCPTPSTTLRAGSSRFSMGGHRHSRGALMRLREFSTSVHRTRLRRAAPSLSSL
ncbi:hypothetical protein SBA1_630038 [Candidatus Sulfotelmatobacter kueseliae]|uniref:Uncharacterized protein n=1 Tax=Candidatus Sulfotelmatobacter kueseliae TaxID=2042962 RepID=A0A2U3L2S3_9BACT|nr:hypothetical protein SBA1_630038 [Candidatus Sulfotelmatobacter kueseliae]